MTDEKPRCPGDLSTVINSPPLEETVSGYCLCGAPSSNAKENETKKTAIESQDHDENDRILLGENVTVKTYASKSKRLVSKNKRYIPAQPVAEFVDNLDRQDAIDTDTSFPTVYGNYLQRTGQIEKESMPCVIRMKKYWKTRNLVQDSDDIEYRMQISLSELVTFILFVLLLTLTFYLDVYPSQYKYHFTNSVRRAFITSDFKSLLKIQMNFDQIKSAGDIWGYLTKKLIETLHPTYYYNFDELRIKKLYYFDNNPIFENALIGTTRIRMKRVKNDSCLVHNAFRRSFKRVCYSYYSPSVEDTHPLGTDFIWQYQNGASNDTGTWGEFGYYTTGGYSQLLYWKSERDSRIVLYSMKHNQWLTRATRVMIVDFLLFNPTINYFCKVRLTFELPPEGGVNPLVSIDTVKLIFPMETRDYIILGLFIVLLWYAVYYAVEEFKKMSFFNFKYCLYPSHFLDLAICLMTLYIVVYILVKTFYFRSYITRAIRNTTTRRYISLDNIVLFEKIYIKMAGFLLFLCFLKISSFLNLTSYMCIINITIKRSIKQFIGYLLYLGFVLSAFAFFGYLLFGNQSKYFRTWWISFFSLISIIFGDFNYLEFYQSDKIIGPIYFAIFLFTVCFHLVYIFLGIVYEMYTRTQTEHEQLGIEHSLPYDKYIKRGLFNINQYFVCNRASKSKKAKYTLLRVKNALLKNNFTPTEINMFFAKYGIDIRGNVTTKDICRIIKDFEKKGYFPTETPTREDLIACNRWKTDLEPEEILAVPRHQNWSKLKFKDFKNLMKRMRGIEKQINKTSRRVAAIVELMDYYSKHFWKCPRQGKKGEAVGWCPGKSMKKRSFLDKLDKTFKRSNFSIK